MLEAVERAQQTCSYVPFDVSESILRAAGRELIEDFPWLVVQGIVGDYERDLDAIPRGSPALFMFLGGTIGNFDKEQTLAFLSSVRTRLGPEDWLLLGTDLVKASPVLDRAYNDSDGVTAAFNKNVLAVINRELGASFNLDQFEHVAFFNEKERQIEMHLESKRAQSVSIPRLEMQVTLEQGERILTEVSRKFTRDSVEETLGSAGLELCKWLVSDDSYFALSLSRTSSPRNTDKTRSF
jgi:L-histidine N-alpha-methyltransferase